MKDEAQLKSYNDHASEQQRNDRFEVNDCGSRISDYIFLADNQTSSN